MCPNSGRSAEQGPQPAGVSALYLPLPARYAGAVAVDLASPELYLNRELSWLSFNERVLELAMRLDVPLLERMKFVAISASNLDEFYIVRVGGLERELRRRVEFETGRDGLRLAEVLEAGHAKAKNLAEAMSQTLTEMILPELSEVGIRFVTPDRFEAELGDSIEAYYRSEVHPTLTPIAIDPSHPFPILRSGTLNLALTLEPNADSSPIPGFERREGALHAIVQVPSVLPRFVNQPGRGTEWRFVALEDIIARYAHELFPGHHVLESCIFRLTRAGDLDIAEEDAEDLLSTIRDQLRRRDRGEPVRMEISSGASEAMQDYLLERVGLKQAHLHRAQGFLALSDLMKVYGAVQRPDLRDPGFSPLPSPRLRYAHNLFRAISERDVLLHHPYETFQHVVDFIEQAAEDPEVVAIKQTLYRTSGDSPIVRALARAAEQGKDVTALVELKARFDEANNIAWARRLEEAGVHVVYGLIGLKTHCKMLLVTRREGTSLRRYLHLGTGNYHPSTARMYTDLGLFTAREDITHDAMILFNVLTGYAELPPMKQLVVAPFTLRAHVLDSIEREIEHAEAGRPAGLVAKMNSLVDGEIIEALYRASQAGVSIDLIVRGICCLRPGVPGVSENIRVRSILDRFLEHSRVFLWRNGGEPQLYLSSADWMPRNLNRRIEVCFPILDEELARRIEHDMLTVELEDNLHAWILDAEGRYTPVRPSENDPHHRTQARFIESAIARSKRANRAPVRQQLSGKPLSPVMRLVEARRRRSEGG